LTPQFDAASLEFLLAGKDLIKLAEGADGFYSRLGNDKSRGGIGADALNGGFGNGKLYGGVDDERLKGGGGSGRGRVRPFLATP
jgi:Ca2+-binding RTX toxin-like protein